jgi:hypothetical protein
MKKALAVLAVPAVALVAVSAPAHAGAVRGTATLSVSTADGARLASSTTTAGSSLVFKGCGYAPGVGVSVVVQSPSATSFFGGMAGSDGCFSSSGTYVAWDAGSYHAASYQSSKRRADATVDFVVAP